MFYSLFYIIFLQLAKHLYSPTTQYLLEQIVTNAKVTQILIRQNQVYRRNHFAKNVFRIINKKFFC